MVFTEHFSDHNQQEVKKDLQFLIAQECFKTSTELKNFKQEVSQHFTDENLIKTIEKLFKKDDDCNETATPAHNFITQLCLIRCGLGILTKIDSLL